MNTTLKHPKTVKRAWYQLDASKFVLGRLSTQAARLLSGKHRVDYTPHIDMGDFVVVVNAGSVKLTGRKLSQKRYYRFSGYHGGITATSLKDLLAKRPEQVIRHAVYGMMPKNKLRKIQMRRLKALKENKHNFKIDKIIS